MPSPLDQRDRIVTTLYSAVLSDVMDGLGLMEQALKPFVRPLDEASVLFGRARTGLYMPRYQVAPGEDPYEVEIALVDDLKPGDVAVFACNGPTDRIAPWGELLSTVPVIGARTTPSLPAPPLPPRRDAGACSVCVQPSTRTMKALSAGAP